MDENDNWQNYLIDIQNELAEIKDHDNRIGSIISALRYCLTEIQDLRSKINGLRAIERNREAS